MTIVEFDDPDPAELFQQGFDVVLLLHDHDDRAFKSGAAIRLSFVWRPGLAAEMGCDPPAPFSVRYDGRGWVRLPEPGAAV